MTSPQFTKTIGILGGMGPEASANLYKNIITHCQNVYHAEQDYEYPAMMISNLPLVGFDESGILDEELVLKQLLGALRSLERAGVDIIIIACNTVHVFYQQMQSASSVPILNLIEETAKRVSSDHYQEIALLCSESTSRLRLYDQCFEKNSLRVHKPTLEEQLILNEKILSVMSGKQHQTDKTSVQEMIFRMKHDGAEAVVLGCTEIPLIINQSDTSLKVYDSCQIIIEEVLKCAR